MKKEFNIMPQTKVGLKTENYEKRFYFDDKLSFEDIRRVVSLMARFTINKTFKTYRTDYYYETPDNFFAGFDAVVRLRQKPSGRYVSIKYEKVFEDEIGKHKDVKEFERKTLDESKLVNDEDTILFLEDKIREVYNHHVDLQVTRKIKEAKVYMVIHTDRMVDNLKNNDNFSCAVCYDTVYIKTKRRNELAKCLEIKLTCVPTEENLEFYERFLKELRNRIILFDMTETKYELAQRLIKFKKENKKELEEVLEEFHKKYPPFEDNTKNKKKDK